jgi:hypothetical protein
MIRKVGSGHGSGFGVVRSVIEDLLRFKRLDQLQDRSSAIIRSLLGCSCIFILAEVICKF